MKLKYIKKSLIPALVAMLSFSSCLKDDNVNLDFNAVSGKTYVGIADPTPSSATYNSTGVAVVSDATEVTVPLTLTYMSNNSNPGTTVTLKVETNKAIIDTYNAARSTDYHQLDPASYSLPNTQITIPAGAKTVSLPVIIKPNTIVDAAAVYALPIVVTNASGAEVSGNYGVHMVLISIKNPYDGIYQASGVFTHPTLGPRDIDQEKEVTTVSPTTSETTVGDLANFTNIEVDKITNVVTVIGNISATQPIVPTPGKTSTYDPATKTFHLYYQYSGVGGNRVIVEDLKYLRARP